MAELFGWECLKDMLDESVRTLVDSVALRVPWRGWNESGADYVCAVPLEFSGNVLRPPVADDEGWCTVRRYPRIKHLNTACCGRDCGFDSSFHEARTVVYDDMNCEWGLFSEFVGTDDVTANRLEGTGAFERSLLASVRLCLPSEAVTENAPLDEILDVFTEVVPTKVFGNAFRCAIHTLVAAV